MRMNGFAARAVIGSAPISRTIASALKLRNGAWKEEDKTCATVVAARIQNRNHPNRVLAELKNQATIATAVGIRSNQPGDVSDPARLFRRRTKYTQNAKAAQRVGRTISSKFQIDLKRFETQPGNQFEPAPLGSSM